ncbi:MAG TPA: SAM-dependent methyltransferase [Streptosporangiaceae bacterium]|nr:SAM-dependent methyltransferase [Streptosporangiaceae bacterium]
MGARYPNTARIWNYQLGGKDNFAVDRKASEAANAMVRGLGVACDVGGRADRGPVPTAAGRRRSTPR